jgi:hypothetical protein
MENMSANVTRRRLCSYFVIAFDVLRMPAVLCWQAHAGTCRHMQAHAVTCSHMQSRSDACRHIYRHMQTHCTCMIKIYFIFL